MGEINGGELGTCSYYISSSVGARAAQVQYRMDVNLCTQSAIEGGGGCFI